MTSTVLDVTVLLLCVSASVVTLGGVGDDADVRGPTAAETADRLVTETETVTYRSPAAANDTRTVHATRAELLALLVGNNGERAGHQQRTDGDGGASFELRATEAVEAGLGPRTRIDVDVPTANRTAGPETPTDDRSDAGPRTGRRLVGAVESPGASTPSVTSEGDGTAIDHDGSDRGGSGRNGRSAPPVTVGGEPPRDADVTTAVVTQPAPDGTEATGPVRIVVRRW
ncbi:hypothetical protein U4E84_02745 [Halorubrum sp. AD140]|uniref:DUF7284 family protein n=1 Tax=Halorubrum sp. AD140 TaxID=3050073 RepID=UPI002ACD0E05|nr:hypothetical protein [Halorubrum sp. AD140]MDZ5810273.1 hypothetical protein [Halorubrum sp. AD140]